MAAKKGWDTRTRKQIAKESIKDLINYTPAGPALNTAKWGLRLVGLANPRLYRYYQRKIKRIRKRLGY